MNDDTPISLDDGDDRADIEDIRDLVRETLELIADLPERAEDFGASVEEKITDIWSTIERTGRVSERQREALENMAVGVHKWFR